MKWFFLDDDILTEEETGFTIRLNAGTWISPKNITHDKNNLTAKEQVKLLRLGLYYARDFMSKRLDFTGSL